MTTDDINTKYPLGYYDNLFYRMCDYLNDNWYITPIKTFSGGVIRAVYKRYPNVFIILDFSHDSTSNKRPLKTVVSFQFYIDDEHKKDIKIDNITVTAHPEQLKLLANGVVIDYCEEHYKDIPQCRDDLLRGNLLYYTGKEYKFMPMYDIRKWDNNDFQMYYSTSESGELTISSTYVTTIPKTSKFIMSTIKDSLEHPYRKIDMQLMHKTSINHDEHYFVNTEGVKGWLIACAIAIIGIIILLILAFHH